MVPFERNVEAIGNRLARPEMVRSRTEGVGFGVLHFGRPAEPAAILEITTEIDDVHSRQLADGESRMAADIASMRLSCYGRSY